MCGGSHQTTELRTLLAKGLETGMRNDAPDNAVWMRQQWRLCEMSLEQTAHRLLARTITELSRGATAGYGPQWEGWVYAPWAMALALSHVRLSRWAPGECTVLVLELGAWAADGDAAHDAAAALRMQVRVRERSISLQHTPVKVSCWATHWAFALEAHSEPVRAMLCWEPAMATCWVYSSASLCGDVDGRCSRIVGVWARYIDTPVLSFFSSGATGVCLSQSTVDRAARLARDYQRQQHDEVAPRARALGDALRLQPEEVRAYLRSEEQRSTAHLVTQLCGLFRKATSSVCAPHPTQPHLVCFASLPRSSSPSLPAAVE